MTKYIVSKRQPFLLQQNQTISNRKYIVKDRPQTRTLKYGLSFVKTGVLTSAYARDCGPHKLEFPYSLTHTWFRAVALNVESMAAHLR